MIEKRRRRGCALKGFLLPIGVVCASFLAIPESSAVTLHVSKNADGTDGVSWATAFHNIGDAVNASASGDSVWVAAGSYNESVTLREGIQLYGGFVGSENEDEFILRNWLANKTIINATGLDERAVTGGSNCMLDGFTLTNAYIKGRLGGGIIVSGVGLTTTMTIRNCDIRKNRVDCIPGIGMCGIGGAMFIIDASVTIENCLICDNFAFEFGGISVADLDSSGDDTSVTISNCFFDGNWNGALGVYGSLVRVSVNNCTFGLNNPGITSCRGNPDVCTSGGSPQRLSIGNSIIRSPVHPNISIFNSNVVGATGNGNIDADPQWVDPENGDYRLKPTSPCIDSGTVTTVLTDLDGNPRPVDVIGIGLNGPGAYDMGAFEFQLSPADLTRNGKVDAEDLIEFQSQWMSEGE